MSKLPKVNLKLAFLIFLCLVFGFSLIKSIARVNQAKKRVTTVQGRVEKLKEENVKLEEELKKMQGDEFVQKELRDKLGLVKEGEVIVVLPDKEALKRLVPQIPEEEDSLPDPNWRRWLKLFGV